LCQVKFRVKKLNADSLAALIPEKDGTEKIDALNLLSNVICRKNIDSSINLAYQAIGLSEKLEYQKGIADGYYNLGNGYFLLDSLQPTIANYLKACRIYEDMESCIEYGRCCLQIALLNYFTRGPEESPPYLNKAVKTMNSIGSREDKYIINFTLAVTHNVVYPPKIDSIIYYGFKAMTFIDTTVDHNELAYIYSEIGEGYSPLYTRPSDTSDLTIALSWFFKALSLQGITDDMKITLYLNIASTYLGYNTEKHTGFAISFLERARNMPDTCIGVYDQKPAIFQMLGAMSYNKEDYGKAISNYDQGIKIAKDRLSTLIINEYPEPIHGYNNRYYIKIDRQLMYEGIYNSYLKLGRYDKALEYYILTKQAADEIFLEQNQNLITMLEAVTVDEKNKSQIKLLSSENELHKTRVKQSRTLMILLGGFAIFFILMSIVILRQRRIRSEQKLLHDLELKKFESRKLKELDQLKSHFFANISHEFRTPLTLILSPTEKLLSKITDESNRNELLLIHRYARRLRRLINQLLNLSKLEAGKLKLTAQSENIVKLVKGFTQSFESLAKQRQVELVFSTDIEELNGNVDRNKLEIIMNNLLSNAFKFTPEGGRVEVSVTSILSSKMDNAASPVSTNMEVSGVKITISDTGQGIPAEHIDRIFERFYLVDEKDNQQHEGTGVGLALTKELVELHHGEIKVKSEMNKGTTFTLILPVEVSEQATMEHNEIDESEHFENIEELTGEPTDDIVPIQKPEKKFDIKEIEERSTIPLLLVVEDNPDLRTHICFHLSDEYNLIEARNGEEGYNQAVHHIPDLIISDVMMPKMDGYELSKKLMNDERTSHIPIILLTALASKEKRIEGLETGADDFITKPFDMDELLIRIKNLIEQRKRLGMLLEKKIRKSPGSGFIDFEDSAITSMDQQFLLKVIAILKEQYSDPQFGAKEFCHQIGLSAAQLNRKLKALTGQTTGESILAFRLNKALEMIKKQSATIAEIAYDVGFNSPSYFTKCFRNYFGKPPTEFTQNT
jgi:signal transduction histidine kinase/DNA-binding response OmpR family regulator